jgi:cytochrome c peroxidase
MKNTLKQQARLRIFVGRGNCSTCHSARIQQRRIPRHRRAVLHQGRRRRGRHGGIRKLGRTRSTCSAPTTTTARARRDQDAPGVTEHRNFGEFKVPSLRNVAQTAPYMHNGSFATLADVVR